MSIGDYALIGDCRSGALISRDGSLDWLCLPRFDSPSIFGALLDATKGGRFRIRPTGEFRSERRYLPQTNVLETTFRVPGGACVLRDLMPVASEGEKRQILPPEHEILREVEGIEGEVEVEAVYDPRPDYGRRRPRLERTGPSATVTSARNLLRSRDVCQTYARTTVVSGDKVLRRGTRHVVNRAANVLRQAANALIRSRSYLGAPVPSPTHQAGRPKGHHGHGPPPRSTGLSHAEVRSTIR